MRVFGLCEFMGLGVNRSALLFWHLNSNLADMIGFHFSARRFASEIVLLPALLDGIGVALAEVGKE